MKLKEYLSNPLLLNKPVLYMLLQLYIKVTNHTARSMSVQEIDDEQWPIHFDSKLL